MSSLDPAPVPALPPPTPPSAPRGRALPVGLAADQRSFAAVLGRGADGLAGVGRLSGSPDARSGSADLPTRDEHSARQAAEQLVAISLVQPVLKQLRESDRAAPPFAPTQAERQFRSLMDAELAQRLVRASGFGLVDRLARDLLARGSADTSHGVRGNVE